MNTERLFTPHLLTDTINSLCSNHHNTTQPVKLLPPQVVQKPEMPEHGQNSSSLSDVTSCHCRSALIPASLIIIVLHVHVHYMYMPSVLWRCWLGGRKGIRPVKKNWVVRCWHGYLSGVRCRLAYGPFDATATHCVLLQWNPDWFYLSGTGPPGLSWKKGR